MDKLQFLVLITLLTTAIVRHAEICRDCYRKLRENAQGLLCGFFQLNSTMQNAAYAHAKKHRKALSRRYT